MQTLLFYQQLLDAAEIINAIRLFIKPGDTLLLLLGKIHNKVVDSAFTWQLFPGTEVPACQSLAQLLPGAQAKFSEQITDMGLDCLGRDDQTSGDLATGMVKTYQCGNLLFARGERLPALPTAFGCLTFL
jgi:hypothetical protein